MAIILLEGHVEGSKWEAMLLSAQMKWVQVGDYRHPGTLGVELAGATWKLNNRGVVSGWRDARDNLPPTVLCNSLGVSLKGDQRGAHYPQWWHQQERKGAT